MCIFISTGEPSGDLHAANLVLSLKKRLPDAEFVGFGGPRMEAAATLLYPLVDLAVMWFGRVLLNLHKFIKLLNDADRYFETNRPDVVGLDRLPRLSLAARSSRERPRHSGRLLRAAATLGLGGLARRKSGRIYRPSAL